jgi:hypothetical protein
MEMSNLIKVTQINLPKEVSIESRSIFTANNSSKIKQIDDMNIVVNAIHQSINRSIADKGVNIELEDINYLKRSITEDILKDFSSLSLEDVQLCFKMGVRGNLGEYYGINVVSFYGWLKKYKEELIPKTFNEVKAFLPSAKVEEEEKNIDYKLFDIDKVHTICNTIIKFQIDGIYNFNDYGNIYYKFLDRHEMFSFTDEIKEQIMEDAKVFVVNEIKDKNLTLLGQGKGFQLENISKVLEKIEYGDKDITTLIQINYMKLLIKHFIKNFSNEDDELEKWREILTKKIDLQYEK